MGKYYFSNVRSGLIVGMLNIGNLCGAILAATLGDLIGRKPSISVSCFVYTVGTIIQISSNAKWYQLVLGRWAGGIGVGAMSVLVPMYVSETAPTHNRGVLVSGYQVFVTLGIFLAYLINYTTQSFRSTGAWRITMGLDFLWALLLGCGVTLLPESPKYVYRKGKTEEARSAMANLLGVPKDHPVLVKELSGMQEKLEAEQADGDQAWWKSFLGPRMAHRTLLGVAILFITSIILGSVNVACTIPGLYAVQRFSHRKCLIFGGLWMSAWFVVFASVGHFALDREDPRKSPKAGAVMVVSACLFIAAFASTWGPISWGESAALYPAKYRARCMAVGTGSLWIWNFLIAFLTPFATASIDFCYGYIFAAFCTIMAVVVYFYLIESQGRTLEELDTMYLTKVKPWESERWGSKDKEEQSSLDIQMKIQAREH
ncbi:low-affinity glucose transporter HXT3 [Physcia stellaris]|nr:low-affinity glucose transporter HXT3 [Physcia stellaris]